MDKEHENARLKERKYVSETEPSNSFQPFRKEYKWTGGDFVVHESDFDELVRTAVEMSDEEKDEDVIVEEESDNHESPLSSSPLSVSQQLLSNIEKSSTSNQTLQSTSLFEAHLIDQLLSEPSSSLAQSEKIAVNPIHERFSCPVCHETFATLDSLGAHDCHTIVISRYSCGVCETSFKSTSDIATHECLLQIESRQPCVLCYKVFKNETDFSVHKCFQNLSVYNSKMEDEKKGARKEINPKNDKLEKEKAPKGEFDCPTCRKRFQLLSDLNDHKHEHKWDQPYKCSICGKGFKRRCYRNKHESSCRTETKTVP